MNAQLSERRAAAEFPEGALLFCGGGEEGPSRYYSTDTTRELDRKLGDTYHKVTDAEARAAPPPDPHPRACAPSVTLTALRSEPP